ncbi:MAG: hypothetical protein FWH05_04240 [Oscillospiraceae bacterium]|nr:hypothetical protein [Oscillospiraceae bacterium]
MLFLIWLAWLTFAHYFKPSNPPMLIFIYLLINMLFGAIMLYTGDRVITRISVCFFHPVILVVLFFGFGNWFLVAPPFVVATVVFFATRSNETLKTVLFTIYLILYVLVVVGYLILQQFSIRLFDVDLKLRQPDYDYSPRKTYRVVRYIDEPTKDDRSIRFYVEKADEDVHLPFLECAKFFDSELVLTARYSREPEVRWLDDTTLFVDGRVQNVAKNERGLSVRQNEFSGETSIILD